MTISSATSSYSYSPTISSSTSSSTQATNDQDMQMQPPEGARTRGPHGKPPSQEDMKAAIDKLKTTNPELADKMQKIGDKMEELKKSGVSPKDAMKQIESEFGKPTDSEMKQVSAALKSVSSSSTSSESSSVDVSKFLSNQTENNDILKMLDSRQKELQAA